MRRTSIEIDGFSHENPVPVASRVGPFLFTGVLTGRDPETRDMPADLDTQCRNAFRHVRAVLRAAGGSIDDIAKITVWLVDLRDREALNREWIAMFPDAASRPARQVVAATLDRGALIHLDVVAVLGDEPA
jgi:enamine deaminase RidA (YjgF/YER057c/UK114 family)